MFSDLVEGTSISGVGCFYADDDSWTFPFPLVRSSYPRDGAIRLSVATDSTMHVDPRLTVGVRAGGQPEHVRVVRRMSGALTPTG